MILVYILILYNKNKFTKNFLFAFLMRELKSYSQDCFLVEHFINSLIEGQPVKFAYLAISFQFGPHYWTKLSMQSIHVSHI